MVESIALEGLAWDRSGEIPSASNKSAGNKSGPYYGRLVHLEGGMRTFPVFFFFRVSLYNMRYGHQLRGMSGNKWQRVFKVEEESEK